MNSFWSGWIIVLTVITFILTFWLLLANRKESTTKKTTGHVYDGIEEYNNPLPLWWLWLFYATIFFSIGYLVAYPGLGAFKGLLNWSQVGQYEKEIQRAEEKYEPLFNKFAQTPIPELAKDTQAMQMAQRIFANNCAQCHGSDARGTFGFPNLADNDWLYGGEPENILTSIRQGRSGFMMAWESTLNREQIDSVVAYTLSLSGKQEANAEGEKLFQTYCTACHGADAKGNTMLGAPNLTDDIWLYSDAPEIIRTTIAKGRNGKMPGHADLLSESRIHLLGAYVYSLSSQ